MLDFILHLDKKLPPVIEQYGALIYVILAAIIFAETAFVIFPFLPGDSLLFAIGLIAADSKYDLSWGGMFFLLTMAAIMGNVVNYWVGRAFGRKFFSNPRSKIFTPNNLARTHEFFERYGDRTVVVTRFVPVIRAFAPFVAGMSEMPFGRFMVVNVLGGALWVGICMAAGPLLINAPVIGPIIQKRFEIAILALVLLSIAPIAIEMILHKVKKDRAAKNAAENAAGTAALPDAE